MKTILLFVKNWRGLLLATGFCAILLLLRISITENVRFVFLLWNLFLAYIPLCISHYLFHRTVMDKWSLGVWCMIWLLFFPNAPYIVTDLMHLGKTKLPIPWLDSVLIFSFAITALTAGIISIFQMEKVLRRYLNTYVRRFFMVLMMPLTGFGIYLGRFERWNSWDLITHPHLLLIDSLRHLTDARAIAISLVLGGCLYIAIVLIQQASHFIYDTDQKDIL